MNAEITGRGCGSILSRITIPAGSWSRSPDIGGNGLVNMRRRASELGGICRIISGAGKGTKIFLEVPFNQPEDEKITPAQSGGENSNGNRL